MRWPRKSEKTEVEVDVTELSALIDRLDEASARYEKARKSAEDANRSLTKTIEVGRRVKTEIETSVAAARRRQRGGW